MSNKTVIKPLALALGATFVTSLAGTTVANAADNPFSMTEFSSGYMVAEKAEGKCCREQFVEAERGEDHQIQHAYAAALQWQRKSTFSFSQPPTDHEQCDGSQCDAQQAELDWKREQLLIVGVLEQKADANEGNDDTHFDRHVATRYPAFSGVERALEHVG